MEAFNRASKDTLVAKLARTVELITPKEVPCIFISYQRKDEAYAKEVAEYILSKQLDVYFDLEDDNLKFHKQENDPAGVTSAIQKGLNESDYMIVIISPETYKSPWVPFEIGYAYERMHNDLKLLRHKNISKSQIPTYLQVKEILNGAESFNRFLQNVRSRHVIYETLSKKSDSVKSFSSYSSNPLNKYLANE
jgi:hypothetical protein